MKAEIITIGDELLIGQVINTNQAFIAEKLNTVGIFIERMTTVGDNADVIMEAFGTAFKRSDVVCVTGGLGPTHDDITKKVVSDFFNSELVMNDDVLTHIKQLALLRNISMIQSNIDQALVPKLCTVIPNNVGTAPGMMFEQSGKYFFVMPGVPFEMKEMIEGWILPFFEKKNIGSFVLHRTLKTTGIGESMLANEIGDVKNIIGNDGMITLAFLPNPLGTKLRITVRETNKSIAEEKLLKAENVLRTKIERYIYSSNDKDLEDVVGDLLRERNMTLAIAESCTGGLISNRITNVAGSSEYFLRGFVVYSNQSKVDELNVPLELIIKRGAVSKEVAESMAESARIVSGTHIALSITGIAGPSGGTIEKPVGTAWIGYSDQQSTFALKFNFGENRIRFKDRASQAALELLRRKLLKQ